MITIVPADALAPNGVWPSTGSASTNRMKIFYSNFFSYWWIRLLFAQRTAISKIDLAKSPDTLVNKTWNIPQVISMCRCRLDQKRTRTWYGTFQWRNDTWHVSLDVRNGLVTSHDDEDDDFYWNSLWLIWMKVFLCGNIWGKTMSITWLRMMSLSIKLTMLKKGVPISKERHLKSLLQLGA